MVHVQVANVSIRESYRIPSSRFYFCTVCIIPGTVMVAEAVDGLSLATVHVYSPALVIVRVCVYCAVTGSFNTVSVPSVIVTESLVQVTVVAGPPVEIQVRVN